MHMQAHDMLPWLGLLSCLLPYKPGEGGVISCMRMATHGHSASTQNPLLAAFLLSDTGIKHARDCGGGHGFVISFLSFSRRSGGLATRGAGTE